MEVLQNAEGETNKYKPGGRLDMSHGFLHHIRRNQIARDDYDREVKQAKEQQKRRHTAAPRRPRRPDREVYHPRHRSESEAGAEVEEWNESGSSTEQENTGTELFWLDYQADSGHVTSFLVYKEDEPESVVERVEQKNVLDAAIKAALLARITQEMDKRRDKR
ncbi:hypothetical protein Q7C36_010632 [Tachysurus vachellii]|uniref:Uncharacterized protein n=1 Tax=Tachysurus vachellii TaxID=175792 RepID=A0AA88SRN8_TACVA|nr:UPF0561 protein C2orf68 homolog [Tachysurus vachellii]KAK2845778.1 hypothetical protein Q7C36_010632 [Tachysurus vachellii]